MGYFFIQNVPSAPNSKLSPLPHEPAEFYNDTYNIPLDSTTVSYTIVTSYGSMLCINFADKQYCL